MDGIFTPGYLWFNIKAKKMKREEHKKNKNSLYAWAFDYLNQRIRLVSVGKIQLDQARSIPAAYQFKLSWFWH